MCLYKCDNGAMSVPPVCGIPTQLLNDPPNDPKSDHPPNKLSRRDVTGIGRRGPRASDAPHTTCFLYGSAIKFPLAAIEGRATDESKIEATAVKQLNPPPPPNLVSSLQCPSCSSICIPLSPFSVNNTIK
ncbi:hypothetical protein JTE90_029532 [Oedothorax gibbosus]|uniref:Uncharacterized protein n=1 Tax=Oedothorax gibbosus TaxID=931172 RepID=A0AAV6VD05_9ARAC|nr:hypothetical protein JTE90_029532 [Oedothorax gibbosus]